MRATLWLLSRVAMRTPTSSQLIVKNISWITGKEQIIEYFSKFGQIKQVTVPTDRVTGLNRGVAFMDFVDEKVALMLLDQKNNSHVIDERKVYVRSTASGMFKEVEGSRKDDSYKAEKPAKPKSESAYKRENVESGKEPEVSSPPKNETI
uniref:RRM domain-containing protein n=1 Tax=Acrobeloides nanus TaxID=290746 RepID=A0A914C817_9BILA